MKLRLSTIPFFAIVALLLQVAAAQTPWHMTPFSADMQYDHVKRGDEMSGKIYVGHSSMRLEMDKGGPRGGGAIMINNMTTQTSDMLMPQQHMYMEFKADQTVGRHPGMAPSIKAFRDPSNPCADNEGKTCKDLGTEQVNGRSTEHWRITGKDGKTGDVWIDKSIHFPIKTVSEDGTWNLTNIKEGEPSASMFEVPPDYRKLDMGNMRGMRPPQD